MFQDCHWPMAMVGKMNSLELLGYAFALIGIGALCERIEEWLRHTREIHRLFKRVQGWERRVR